VGNVFFFFEKSFFHFFDKFREIASTYIAN
jgi:hypothetical protein